MRLFNEGPGAIHAGLILMSGRALRAALIAAGSALLSLAANSQTPPPVRPPEVLAQLSRDAEIPGLAEPFKGITANGKIEPGLFHIRSTGVSTAPVRNAAERFLAGLTKEQRDRTQFGVNDPEWRKWMNQSFYVRQGVSF